MGYSWQYAMTAIFVEGIIFILLSVFKVREAIVDSIPDSLKKAIGVGIGIFIAFIGLKNAGIVVMDESNLVGLSPSWMMDPALLVLIGVVIIGILLVKNIKGALLIGMVATSIIGIPMG